MVRRLSGIKVETSAVYNLTTQFGGGKTHALTLLYHLAKAGPAASNWKGVQALLDKAGVTDRTRCRHRRLRWDGVRLARGTGRQGRDAAAPHAVGRHRVPARRRGGLRRRRQARRGGHRTVDGGDPEVPAQGQAGAHPHGRAAQLSEPRTESEERAWADSSTRLFRTFRRRRERRIAWCSRYHCPPSLMK